ncbi:hypothetical protein WDU94_001334 [Cyamophila willieti]
MEQTMAVALHSVKLLRLSMNNLFGTLSDGVRTDHGEEHQIAANKFLLELQDLLGNLYLHMRELEQAVATLAPPPGPMPLYNSQHLTQESTLDRLALYEPLVQSYKWTDKVHEYSNLAVAVLSQNSLKRSYLSQSQKKRRVLTSSHNVPPQTVDTMIASIDRLYQDMSVTVSRPFASNAVLHVTLGRILQAVIALKGLMIEWVVVKGYGETMDLWTESRHRVFRKITEHAHSAMLHFFSPALPELAVRSFMTWLHSFITVFSDPCKRCNNYLHNTYPPTWRDYRTLDPYHDECKH